MNIFQKSPKKSGFTLIELLVVIAIIGILAFIATGFNFNKKTEIEKRDRFVWAIINLMNKAKTDTMIGRWVLISGNIINPESTKISISTGSIVVNYLSWVTTIGTGEILKSPFYWDTWYVINSINTYTQDENTGSTITSLIMKWSTIDFDTTASGSVVLDIEAGYNKNYKHLRLDKRTGRMEIE